MSVLGQINLGSDLNTLRAMCAKYFGKVDRDLMRMQYRGSLTWNPVSIANGASLTSSDITVPNARVGDHVKVFPPYTLSGLSNSAYVSADDTVKIVLHNQTGGAVDLAEGEWRVMCEKF